MKRILKKFRKKSKAQAESKSGSEPQDPWEQLANMRFEVTEVSHQAIPRNVSRPNPAITSNYEPPSDVAPLRNRINEVCPICLDLDPTVEPEKYSTETDIWVKGLEGRHPERKIRASYREIRDSGMAGCNGCYLIGSGINWARPSLFDSPGFVKICLVGSLPLRVSLYDRPMQTGRDVETIFKEVVVSRLAGRDDVTTGEAILPVEELEFYYPYPDSATWALPETSLEHPKNKAFPLLGYGCKRIMDSTADEVWRAAQYMLKTCTESHEKCRRTILPILPDRVIDVGVDSSARIRLTESEGKREKYMALSYCWGPRQNFTTTIATLASRIDKISWESLPALLQDAMTIARKLSIRYIWIDALCIIQDSVSDWEVQSAKMGEIYKNAHLTLTAASAASVHERILGERHPRWQGTGLGIPDVGSISCRRPSTPWRSFGGETGAISKRAWTMQERLLSSRILTYTEAEIKFECLTCSTFEGQMPLVEGTTELGAPRENYREDWQTFVHWYSARNLTKDTDRFPAVSALAREIRMSSGWNYLAGLWKESLPQGLCWTVEGTVLGQAPPMYIAPSWSWASVNGTVNYAGQFNASITDRLVQWEARIMDSNSVVRGQNDLGAVEPGSFMSLVGLVQPCLLEIPSMTDPPSGKCCHLSPIRSTNEFHRIAIQPDMPLYSPGIVHMRDKERQAVVRWKSTPVVPDPELSSIPFTGGVYCLRLGTIMDSDKSEKNAQAIALILGNSLLEDGAWERLALVDDLPLDFFDTATRELMRIV